MQILAVLPNMLAPPPEAPLAVLVVRCLSELCLETCVNVFGRGALFAENPSDDSLAILHPVNEKS
jgi:hypothetical protein